MAVAYGWISADRFTGHCGSAWWHNNNCLGIPVSDSGVDTGLIIGAIAGERGRRAPDLIEQGIDLRGVVNIFVGQCRRHDPARIGVGADVQLAPGSAPARAMVLDQPLAGTA